MLSSQNTEKLINEMEINYIKYCILGAFLIWFGIGIFYFIAGYFSHKKAKVLRKQLSEQLEIERQQQEEQAQLDRNKEEQYQKELCILNVRKKLGEEEQYQKELCILNVRKKLGEEELNNFLNCAKCMSLVQSKRAEYFNIVDKQQQRLKSIGLSKIQMRELENNQYLLKIIETNIEYRKQQQRVKNYGIKRRALLLEKEKIKALYASCPSNKCDDYTIQNDDYKRGSKKESQYRNKFGEDLRQTFGNKCAKCGRMSDGRTGIFETKSEGTAITTKSRCKAARLSEYIELNKDAQLFGGMVMTDGGQRFIYSGPDFTAEEWAKKENWIDFDAWFNKQ